MYTPHNFRETNPSVIISFIRKHSFGVLLTGHGDKLTPTYTPFVLSDDENYLYGHIAKANPQWKDWQPSTTATVLFTGPHCYISPSYYASEFNVPTWNYTAISVSGQLSVVDEETQIVDFIESLIALHESKRSDSWTLDHSDQRYMQLLSSIVVFQIEISDLKAAFKLSQNKSLEDQQSVISHLRESNSTAQHQVASMMERNFAGLV